MSRNKPKKATTSSPIDFNNNMTLELWLGVDYAKTFYMMIVVGRLQIADAQHIVTGDHIHEFCHRNSTSGKQSESDITR